MKHFPLVSKKNMSCSSSEDENVELLKEAQDNQFLKDCMFSGKQEKLNSAIEKTVSLRKTTDDDDYNIFKVTAEFRDYVAKNLSLLLEKNLKRNLEYIASDEVTKKRRKHGGIKLFSNSDKCLKLEIETVEKVPSSKTPFSAPRSKTAIDKNSLKQIAVSGNDILEKKDTKHWSNRTKSQIFRYKKTARGELVLYE